MEYLAEVTCNSTTIYSWYNILCGNINYLTYFTIVGTDRKPENCEQK